MDDFAGWLAWTLLKQRIQCGVNGLYPRAGRGNFNAQCKLQSSFQNKIKELGFFFRSPWDRWSPGNVRKKWTTSRLRGKKIFKEKCSIRKIGYFTWFPQKFISTNRCIKIQTYTLILKNTIPFNLFCKVNHFPINRSWAHMYTTI